MRDWTPRVKRGVRERDGLVKSPRGEVLDEEVSSQKSSYLIQIRERTKDLGGLETYPGLKPG